MQNIDKNHIASVREEMFNSSSHAVGMILSIIGLVVLIIHAAGNLWEITAFSIFGICVFLMFLNSTLYHAFSRTKYRNLLRTFDHLSIYLLIAGTYTAVMLTRMRNGLGVFMLIFLWSTAIIGIILKIKLISRHTYASKLSALVYLLMGWSVITIARPVIRTVPIQALAWILLGGIYYSVGVIFYLGKRIPFHHLNWHLFVIGGTVAHYIGMFYL